MNKGKHLCHLSSFCESCFLAPYETFEEVYNNDLNTLIKMGITCEQISEGLISILKDYSPLPWNNNNDDPRLQGLNIIPPTNASIYDDLNKYIIQDKFVIVSMTTMGYQECPFCNEGKGSTDYTIVNLKTKESLQFSDLVIHLIKHHHFFEGSVPYRVDPLKAIKVLEL